MTLKELHLPSANYILEHIFGENIQVVNGRICWTKLGEKKGQDDFFFFFGVGEWKVWLGGGWRGVKLFSW